MEVLDGVIIKDERKLKKSGCQSFMMIRLDNYFVEPTRKALFIIKSY